MNKFMSPKNIVLFTVFIDVLGIGVVIPSLPYYVQSFGATPSTVTLLFSVFSLFAFFSAPLLGAWSDKIGRRPILILSIVSSAVGWFTFAAARSIYVLFLGRVIDGLAAGNFSTAQSYLADLSKDEKERTHNLGLSGAIFGIGFIIGPMIGGLLAHYSNELPFWFVGALASLNAVLAYFNLPETHHKREAFQNSKSELNPFVPIWRSFKNKVIAGGLSAWFLLMLAVAFQQSVFALYIYHAFGFGAAVSGLFLTGIGVILSINQGFLLKRFWIKRFKVPELELGMLLVLACGFFLMSYQALGVFIAGIITIAFSQSVLRVVMTSQIVGGAGERRGEVMGVTSSLMSLAMIIGPILSGYAFEYEISLPFIISGLIALAAWLMIYSARKRLAKIKLAEQAPAEYIA